MSKSRALVTGANSGVGEAIAKALAAEGYELVLVARRAEALHRVADEIHALGGRAVVLPADLTSDEALAEVGEQLAERELDVLVHSAGTIARAPVLTGTADDFDRQMRLNLRAPFLLTQRLLPGLIRRKGEVVFINSSSGVSAKAGGAGYDGSKHALRALADSLRQEVNADGVRVASIYLGQTASPMQKKLSAELGRSYDPECLIQPADVAITLVSLLRLPRTAEITDLHMRPMQKS